MMTSKKMIVRTVTIILMILLCSVMLFACSGGGGGGGEDPKGKDIVDPEPEPDPDEKDPLAEAYLAYKDVLEQNKDAIANYNWQNGTWDQDGPKDRLLPVALCDINGDDIPELFFMAAVNEYQAELNIYSMRDGKAYELTYEGRQQEAGRFADTAVAAGTQFAVYTGKTPGTMYIYFVNGDEMTYYTIFKYKVNSDGSINRDMILYNETGPNEDYSGRIDDYYIDGEGVAARDGANKFTAAFSDIGKVIIFSRYQEDGADQVSLWKNFNAKDALMMSYDDAIGFLTEKTSKS